MPIRFNCEHCQQMLSIGTSKADSVVVCPRCHGEVAVPTVSSSRGKEKPDNWNPTSTIQLHAKNERQGGRVVSIDVPAFRIGRAKDCHLRSGSSRISPQHCVIHVHDDTVTVLDLGSEHGTYVNGKRISAPRELKDRDVLTVGRHSFDVSIQANVARPKANQNEDAELDTDPLIQSYLGQGDANANIVSPDDATVTAPSAPETEAEAEEEDDGVLFDVRLKGQNVSVTKKRLFAMARAGALSPDDIITVDGTKIFADSIHGIVFGGESSSAVPPPVPEIPNPEHQEAAAYASPYDPFEFYELEKGALDSPPSPAEPTPLSVSAPVEVPMPFDIADEPHAHVARLPSAQQQKKSFFSDLRENLDSPLSQASTEAVNYFYNKNVQIGSVAVVGICLLGMLLYWYVSTPTSKIGAIRIVGTITLDGKPVEMARVILHPRNSDTGFAAGGISRKNGKFVVTTGNDPLGCGVVPGEYDVTFLKRGEIPSAYENPETSGQTLTVESNGKKTFVFELASVPAPPEKKKEQEKDKEKNNVITTIQEPESPRFMSIFAAIESGTLPQVEDFVKTNPTSVNAKDVNGNTPLHIAAQGNSSMQILEYLLPPRSANIDAKNNNGDTPLDVAVEPKKTILVKAGAKTGKPQPAPSQPPLPERPRFANIFAASATGMVGDVDFFLTEKKVSANEKDQEGNTPLHHAARVNTRVEVLQHLIDCRADVNAKNNSGDTPLHLAARNNKNVAVLQYILPRSADINVSNNTWDTPWDIADTAQKKEILSHEGGKTGKRRIPRYPSIFEAAAKGTVEDVEDHLHPQIGASVNDKDDARGWTPLHHAANYNSDAEVLSCLIEKGANVDARNNKEKNTPLHLAAQSKDDRNAAVLRYLSQKASVNIRNGKGDTPWDLAGTNAKKDIIADAGGRSGQIPPPPPPPPDKTPFAPKNIFEAAAKGTIQNIENYLREGIDINRRDGFGWTPLHHAANYNSEAEVLNYLIEKGANVNARANNGFTPLDVPDLVGANHDILRIHGGKKSSEL